MMYIIISNNDSRYHFLSASTLTAMSSWTEIFDLIESGNTYTYYSSSTNRDALYALGLLPAANNYHVEIMCSNVIVFKAVPRTSSTCNRTIYGYTYTSAESITWKDNIGDTDISAIGDNITAAISALNSDKVSTDRTINSKALSSDITLTASDVGAAASSHTHSNYASTVSSSGNGNAVTALSQSGNTITYTKGSTFSLSGHTHSFSITSLGNATLSAGSVTLSQSIQNFNLIYAYGYGYANIVPILIYRAAISTGSSGNKWYIQGPSGYSVGLQFTSNTVCTFINGVSWERVYIYGLSIS